MIGSHRHRNPEALYRAYVVAAWCSRRAVSAANSLFWAAYEAARGRDAFAADIKDGLVNDEGVRAAVNLAVRDPAYVTAEALATDAKGSEKRTWVAYANSIDDPTARRSRFNPVLAAESGFFREVRTDHAVHMSTTLVVDIVMDPEGRLDVRVDEIETRHQTETVA